MLQDPAKPSEILLDLELMQNDIVDLVVCTTDDGCTSDEIWIIVIIVGIDRWAQNEVNLSNYPVKG